MPVSSVAPYDVTHLKKTGAQGTSENLEFSSILQKNQAENTQNTGKLKKLGSISDATPTVSHILKNSPHITGNYWHVLYSEQNQNKKFDNLRDGAPLYIDTQSKELFASAEKVNQHVNVNGLRTYLKGMLKDGNEPIELGVLSKDLPTVSQLVRTNENVKGSHWDIIHAEVNRDKPYASLSFGTKVSIDPNTLEFIFKKPEIHKKAVVPELRQVPQNDKIEEISRKEQLVIKLQSSAGDKNNLYIGTLDKNKPTVSQVLRGNQVIKGFHWDIINDAINSKKPYTSISDGTQISINPNSLELNFTAPPTPVTAEKVQKVEVKADVLKSEPAPVMSATDELKSRLQTIAAGKTTLSLGVLNESSPTVSQVLRSNENVKGFHWDIINDAINSEKPYTSITEGTQISINPNTLELNFTAPPAPVTAEKTQKVEMKADVLKSEPAPVMSAIDELKSRLQTIAAERTTLTLGVLNESSPTVSQVLRGNENIKGLHWNIINAEINSNKEYSALQPGTKICIDPKNLELIFEAPLIALERNGEEAKECSDKQTLELSKPEQLKKYITDLFEGENEPVVIGSLTKEASTVSQLLNNDERFKGYHWGIITSDVNKNKPYGLLKPGTQVSIDPKNMELHFSVSAGAVPKSQPKKEPVVPVAATSPPAASAIPEPVAAAPEKAVETQSLSQSEKLQTTKGTPEVSVSSQAPVTTQTVTKSSRPAKAATVGKSSSEPVVAKPVISQPQSQEIVKETVKSSATPKPPVTAQAVAETLMSEMSPQSVQEEAQVQSFSGELAASVKSMVGNVHDGPDRYDLLFHALQDQGIKYSGSGGLKENLQELAILLNRENKEEFLNQEGITKLAGETVYSKISGANTTQAQMNFASYEIENFLEEGQVIAMSTPTEKFTGIVSKNEGAWTCICLEDINDAETPFGKGVSGQVVQGDLLQEMRDRQKAAVAGNEKLTVTLVKLNEDTIRNLGTIVSLLRDEITQSKKN